MTTNVKLFLEMLCKAVEFKQMKYNPLALQLNCNTLKNAHYRVNAGPYLQTGRNIMKCSAMQHLDLQCNIMKCNATHAIQCNILKSNATS